MASSVNQPKLSGMTRAAALAPAQKRLKLVTSAIDSQDVEGLASELKARPLQQPADYVNLLKATYVREDWERRRFSKAADIANGNAACNSSATDVNSSPDSNVKKVRDCIFSCFKDSASGRFQTAVLSLFKSSMIEAAKLPWLHPLASDIFEREHDHLLRADQFLLEVAQCGFLGLLPSILEKTNSWPTENKQKFIFDHNRDGVTAFIHAIRRGHVEAVKTLVDFCSNERHQICYVDKNGANVHLLDRQAASDQGDTPLHEAIWLLDPKNTSAETNAKDNALEIVKYIIDFRPETLFGTNKNGEPPYTYAKNVSGIGGEVEVLVKNRIFEKLSIVSQVRRALYARDEQEKELSLDMSDFNQSSHDFNQFVKHLHEYAKPNSVARDLLFEETLLYVYLPDLQLLPDKNVHDAMELFFSWLWGHGVKKIKELSIPDSRFRPLSEDFVQESILKKFKGIEKLDWRKLDLDLTLLAEREEVVSKLTDLTLYSSGNWSVLYHWASADGIAKLEKLNSLTINIIRPMSWKDDSAEDRYQERAKQHKKCLEEKFDDLKLKFKPKVFTDVRWPPLPSLGMDSDINKATLPRLRILDRFTSCHAYLRKLDQASARANPSDYAQRLKDRPVKVAIIDNGADKIQTTLSKNLEKGRSFVYNGQKPRRRILPWWMVADPHGTQMASLIQSVNPYCRLYIARVGKWRRDISAAAAAKAVLWAIEQKVQVISISWTLNIDDVKLRDAIQHAASENIIIFCSTADQGVAVNTVYPAKYPGVISVSAADRYANPLPSSDKEVQVLIDGQDMLAAGPAYMPKHTSSEISGSSVATALAAGIASLALLLIRISRDSLDEAKLFENKDEMLTIFEKMGPKEKAIQPDKLFQMGFSTDPENMRHPKWIENFTTTFTDTSSSEGEE